VSGGRFSSSRLQHSVQYLRVMRRASRSNNYELETAKATLGACEWDLEREEDRMRGLDAKLTQLATFSGVSISISGGLGASVLAASKLELGFLIALGACIAVAASLLLSAVIVAFRALAPKTYIGVDEGAVAARTTPNALKRPPAETVAGFAASRREVLVTARGINDRKATSATRVFLLVGMAFAALVAGLVVTAVGSVV
jgi:hypothetical protein